MLPGDAGAHQRTLLAILQRQYVGEKEIGDRDEVVINLYKNPLGKNGPIS